MLIMILLLFLFSLFSIKLLYYPIFWFLKWYSPVKKFTVPTSRLKEILRPSEDEWELDKLSGNQILTISGNCANDGLIYIQLIRNAQNICWATIYLLENEIFYHGEFEGRCEEDSRKIICGPLLLDMRLPFRRWRVNFKGHLKSSAEESKLEFVSISGWWKSVTSARFFYSNTSPYSFASLIEKSKFSFVKNGKIIAEYRRSEVLHQMGELFAEVRIGKDYKVENRYRGLRETMNLEDVKASTQFWCYLSDGNSFSHSSSSEVEHGLFFKSNHSVFSISLNNWKPDDCLDETNYRPIIFDVAHELPFELRKNNLVRKFDYKRPDNKIVDVTVIKVNAALATGFAFVVRIRPSFTPYPVIQLDSFPEYQSFSSIEKTSLVLPFAHRACQDKSLTGGKGANLARLQAITNDYHVPNGIVVTTFAFDQHVQEHENIQKLIKKLDHPSERFVEIGIELEQEFVISEISDSLKSKFIDQLPEAQYYAVRSSAVGEDGADLSSAGQLESYLDTVHSDIFEKLKLCWASNFRREVLNYRRNHGQQLNPSMAVVIQEMNRNGVAGVLFTANPVTIDRSEMVINALKGSGELIVSGVETPDEIHFNRHDNKISITSSSESCCLQEEEIHHLCRVGEYLERVFGRPQDVEFVYRNGKLNIVQSRDITGLDKETNFEMYYELDTPTFTDHEILSNGNVGEVMPAPLTAMESDQMCALYDKILMSMILEDMNDQNPSQVTLGFALHHRKVFMNFGELMLRTWEACKKDQIIEIVVAGERMFDKAMFQQSADRFGYASKTFDIRRLVKMLKQVFITSYQQVEAVKIASKKCAQSIPSEQCSVEEAIKFYERQVDSYFDATLNHANLSTFSSFTYVICGMLIRGSDSGDLSDENISDFANVFSNNSRTDVISADVPNSLKKLAAAIKEDNLATELLEKAGIEALEVIRKGENSGEQLKKFLELHGHRGPKELYLDATTWAENTDLLVHTIKSMLNCVDTIEKNIENEDDIINSLKCKPEGLRRTLLKYFIRQTHRGVAFRETSKNHLVSSVYSVRQTCRLIGKKLFEKGYLPDANLWLHLTIDEIKELNLTRKAELVSRAVRRQQIAGKYEGLQFPLITHGHMNPIKEDIIIDRNASLTLRGTTVCEGKVVAKARVAKSLEEATQTLPGEILITRYTDISWSPFFPIISGIVTEIGGLLSHGAVVAREYGLPSLIAVTNATQHFKTGDLVELDSIKGVISRLDD